MKSSLGLLPTLSEVTQATGFSYDRFFTYRIDTQQRCSKCYAASLSRCPSLHSVRALVHGLLFPAREMRCSWKYVADNVAAAARVGSRMLNRSGSRIHKLFHQRSWQVRSFLKCTKYIVCSLHFLAHTLPSASLHAACFYSLALDRDFGGSLLLAEGIRG